MSVRQVPLKHVAHLTVSNVDKKSAEGQRTVRLCNYVDVYKNDSIDLSLDFMSATATDAQVRQFRLLPGDTLITKDSETAEDIAVPAYVEESAPDLVCGYHLAIVRPGPDMHPRFLYWAMSSNFMRGQMTAAATGVTRYGLRQDAMGSALVTVPALDEQRRIAAFLDAETSRIDRLIELRHRQRAYLDERRWAFVRAAVADFGCPTRRPASLGWVDDLPASWEVVPLKYVARYGSGHTPSRTHPDYWVGCDIPWISLFDVGRMRDATKSRMNETTQRISALGMANSSACLHPAGTVVLSRTASVGFATIMGVDMAVSQHFATWTCGPRLLPDYLLHVLRAMKQTWESLQVGTTNVTVFMPDLLALRVPLPPLEEQARIIRRIEDATVVIDRLCDRLTRQRALLVERRSALVAAAVTGQLDVTTARGAE